jgi:hypothetical protein
MQQTAVEWLVKQLNDKVDFIPLTKWDEIRDLVAQAKEMEKQRHSETWHDSRENTCIPFEQYYTQTYTNESR